VDIDWFMESVARVRDAASDARSALAASVASLEASLEAHRADAPLVEVVDGLIEEGGVGVRTSALEATERYERAVLLLRARVLSHLVTDDGLTLSEAARRLGISRQRAGLLLAEAADGTDGTADSALGDRQLVPPLGT
jgi:hypothetical protein